MKNKPFSKLLEFQTSTGIVSAELSGCLNVFLKQSANVFFKPYYANTKSENKESWISSR